MEPSERTYDQRGRRRLVLGFDAGCARCSDLAAKIEERVGGELEVRSLHHPHVERWREQALGEDAPWAPTLFEVGGVQEVRAWTGAKMAVRLVRALGPVSTWRVMQALGEVGGPRTTVEGMSRGQFLKGAAGAALASSVLAGAAKPSMASVRPEDLTAEQRRVQKEFVERYRQTPVGQEFTLVNEDGKKLTFERTAKNVVAEEGISSAPTARASLCVQAVLAGVYAIGAGALAAAAAAGTSLLIAGILIGPRVLGILAGALTAGSGLQAAIATYIC